MKWITLDEIKEQLRIEPDYNEENDKLTRYGNSAEATILNITGRTYEELKNMNPMGEDTIPPDVWEATIMIVVVSYEHNSPIDNYQMYAVPYGVDMKLKPYIKL